MRIPAPSRGLVAALSLGAVGIVSACAGGPDPRIEQLTRGITRDSAMVILNGGTAPAPGATPHAISSGDLLVNGANYTVLYWSPDIEEGTSASEVKKSDVTPVIIQNGMLVGWGWEFHNNMATQTHFAAPAFKQ